MHAALRQHEIPLQQVQLAIALQVLCFVPFEEKLNSEKNENY